MDQQGRKSEGGPRTTGAGWEQPGIAVRSQEGVRVVELAGDHDVLTAASVKAALLDESGARENVVLSLERVTFIDSAIVGVIYTSSRALIESGFRLVIHCPATTPICQVLRLAYVTKVVDVVGTFDEALNRAALMRSSPVSRKTHG